MRVIIAITTLLLSFNTKGSESISGPFLFKGDSLIQTQPKTESSSPRLKQLVHTAEKKITAIALALLLGPFGAHRLYLGTRPLVPIVYTLTLGGGLGLLPLTDIIAILTTKDFEKYKDNDQIIMWIK